MNRHDLSGDVLGAALRCLARWGVSKTNLDDIAREAGCSRATVYRLFPGGKDSVFRQLAEYEVGRFFASVADRLERSTSVEELLVEGMTEALRQLREHPALSFMLEHEPAAILPHPTSDAMAHVISVSVDFIAPYLERWLEPPDARRAAEWTARMTLSYAAAPPAGGQPFDLTGARDVVDDLLAPAVRRLATPVPSL